MKRKFIVDVSSVLTAYMFLPDEEFGEDIVVDGKKFHIPALETCMERATDSMIGVLDRLGFNPTDMILVKDPEKPGEARKRLYPDYKGKREKRPAQYYAVYNELVEKFCEMAMRSGAICATPRVVPSVEADDLVHALAKQFPESTIYSRDKDLLSCPAAHHLIDKTLDPFPYPVPNELIHLYRAIVTGDASDNIPGCKGFGEKAWEEMLGLIGPEGIVELEKMVQERRLHELEEDVTDFKKFRLLIDKADDIYMSYRLMTFSPVPAHKIKWEARVTDCSKTLVTKDNFSFVFEDVVQALKTTDHTVIDFETDVPDESIAWLAGTKNEDGKGGVAVDVMASEITGMGLKIGDQSWYFSVDHAETDNIKLWDLEEILNLIKDKRCYAANATGFENVILYKTFGYFLEEMVDTQLLASYVNENDFLGLKHLSKRDLGYEQQTYEETLAGRRGMRDVTGQEVLNYGIDDVITCDSLQNLHQTILQFEGSLDVFYEVEKDSAFVTSLAFVNGVDFDWGVYHKLKAENDANMARASKELEELLLKVGFGETKPTPLPALLSKATVAKVYETVTGKEFKSSARSVKSCIPDIDNEEVRIAVEGGIGALNDLYLKYWKPRADINIRSPKQVSVLLYDVLGAPVRIRNTATETMRNKGLYEGNPSTDDEAIANAIAFKDISEAGIECLQKLEEYKGYLTRESLFLSKYPKFVHWKTGKLHCSMRQCGTTTRRFTHSAPNLAQQSKKKGKEMRNMIKAPEGFYIASLDFASQELRMQAEDCGCKEFVACYLGDKVKDVHSSTGYQVSIMQGGRYSSYEEYEKLIADGDAEAKKFRADGKATNFSSAYGCRAKRLSNMLAIPEGTAQLFLDAKAKAFPGLVPHVEKYNDTCHKRGYSETFMGVRRHLAKSYAMAKNESAKAAVDRLAWSFRIQGSSAEQVKLVMSRLWREGLIGKYNYLLVTIHDELVMVIHEDKVDEVLPKIHAIVTSNYADMKIPMESTPEVGKNFGSLKEYELDKLT